MPSNSTLSDQLNRSLGRYSQRSLGDEIPEHLVAQLRRLQDYDILSSYGDEHASVVGRELIDGIETSADIGKGIPRPVVWVTTSEGMAHGVNVVKAGESLSYSQLIAMAAEANRDVLSLALAWHRSDSMTVYLSRWIREQCRGALDDAILAIRHIPQSRRSRGIRRLTRAEALLSLSHWWAPYEALRYTLAAQRWLIKQVYEDSD